MDSPRSVQPISGSIPSKQVSDVFVVQVAVSTKSTPPVHTLALLDSVVTVSTNSTNSPNLGNKFDILSQLEQELND